MSQKLLEIRGERGEERRCGGIVIGFAALRALDSPSDEVAEACAAGDFADAAAADL